MNTLDVGGRSIPLDDDGYLRELADWSREAAEALAAREGIQLGEAHWEILQLLRRFHAEFSLSPATRPLVRYVAQQLGTEKGNSAYLNRLFNGTPAKTGARLAGLPKPTNCI